MWLSTEQTPAFDGWTKSTTAAPDNFEGKQGLVARVNPDGGWGKACLRRWTWCVWVCLIPTDVACRRYDALSISVHWHA
jgi:hypothetical protein